MGWFHWCFIALACAAASYFWVPPLFKYCLGAVIILFVVGLLFAFWGKIPKGDPS